MMTGGSGRKRKTTMSETDEPTDDEIAAVELANIIREQFAASLDAIVDVTVTTEPNPGIVVRTDDDAELSTAVQIVSEYTDGWAADTAQSAYDVGVLTYDITIQHDDHYTMFVENIAAEWRDA